MAKSPFPPGLLGAGFGGGATPVAPPISNTNMPPGAPAFLNSPLIQGQQEQPVDTSGWAFQNSPEYQRIMKALGQESSIGGGLKQFGFNQQLDPSVAQWYEGLDPTIRNAALAQKTTGGGNEAQLIGEMAALSQSGVKFANESGSNNAHIQRMAGDLARYGVTSLADLKAVDTGKGTVYVNQKNGMLVPADFGSSMKGEGGSYYHLKNVNGQTIPATEWTDSSDKKQIMSGLAVLAAAGGMAAIGSSLAPAAASGGAEAATNAAGAMSGGGGGFGGGFGGGGAAAGGGGASGVGLSTLPAAGTWAQTATPLLGAGAGEWTLPAALAGVSGATQTAGGLTLADALRGAYQGSEWAGVAPGEGLTSAGGPQGLVANSWIDQVKELINSPDQASQQAGKTLMKKLSSGDLSGLGGLLQGGLGAAGSIYNMMNPPQYPELPDYASLMDKQQQAARENATWQLQQNRPDQYTPFAQSEWSQDPATGEWKQNVALNPADQQGLDLARQQSNLLMAGMGPGSYDPNSTVFQANWNLAQPQLQQQRAKENARLAAMGLGTGSGQAWSQAQGTLNQSENDAYQKALLAGFEAQQKIGEGNRQNLGGLQNQQKMYQGNLQMPQFANAALPPTPNYVGAGQQNYEEQWNQMMNQRATQEKSQQGLLKAGEGILGGVGKMTGWW